MDIGTRCRLYKMLIRPLIEYGLDAVPLSQRQVHALQKFQNLACRMLFFVGKRAKVDVVEGLLGLERVQVWRSVLFGIETAAVQSFMPEKSLQEPRGCEPLRACMKSGWASCGEGWH